MKKLRKYQQDAIDAVHKGLKDGIQKQIVVLPTGAGKSYCAVKALEPFKKKMWCVDREELMDQSGLTFMSEIAPGIDIKTMIDTYGGLADYLKVVRKMDMFSYMADNEIIKTIGIVKAEAFDISGDIVLSSLQTLHRRLDRMNPDMFEAIVIDECHGASSKTNLKSINHFNPKLLLGLTATPFRADGANLGDIFDKIIYQYNLLDAIQEGYLCEFDAIQIKTQLNLDNVRTTAGEFNQKDLRQEVDTPERNELIYNSYKKYADGKTNIVFCVDIKHAKNVNEVFKSHGELSEIFVSDQELTPDRKGTLNRFRSGETTHLVNVGMGTTGLDVPNIQCISAARPTKSLTLYHQMLGRGTRTLPGVIDGIDDVQDRLNAIKSSSKPKCFVLDICDSSTRHKLVNTWSLDRDLPIEKRVFVSAEKKVKLIEARTKKEFEARTQKDTKVNLFEVPKVIIGTGSWTRDPATAAQLIKLQELGFDVEDKTFTKMDATKLISGDPAPMNWVYAAKKMGYNIVNGLTRGEFTKIMDIESKKKEAVKRKENQSKQLGNDIIIDGL